MDPEIKDQELQETLRMRLKELPKPVRDAIQSADIEQHLRELADTHKLHLDQWELLENEVMLTLLGFQQPEDLAAHLEKDLAIPTDLAGSLAADISHIVFEPIRAQLEEELAVSNPDLAEKGGVLEGFEQVVQSPPAPAAVIPATPPPAPPTERAVRAPLSSSYAAQQPSHERKIVEGDPYREQVS